MGHNLAQKGSIRKRLTIIIMIVTLLTSITGYSVFMYWYMNNQYNKTIELSNTIGIILGQDIAKLALLKNISSASDITSKLKSFSSIDKMVLYDMDKKAIFQYSKENKSFEVEEYPKNKDIVYKIDGNSFKLYLDANYQSTHLGYIQLTSKIHGITDIIKRDLQVLFFILLFMFIISYFLAIFFARRFTTPILHLVKFLEKIDSVEAINQRIKTTEENEFGKLYSEVNIMLDRIESSHQAQKIAAVAFETQSGMTITDKNQKILDVNEAFTKITGYEKDEIIGNTPAVLKSGFHNAEFYMEMSHTLKKNHVWVGEIKNKHKNGNYYNEQLLIQSVLDDNNEVIYYVASFLDITKQKETQKELEQKGQLLIQQSKMAQMGEMIENIIHQWRQPLSVITTSASGVQLQKEFDILTDDTLEESLNNIIKSTIHLSETINDFRDFYKEDKVKTKFDLKIAVERSINLLSSKFKSQNIDITLDIEHIEIEAFENELIQVFINILNNAKDELTLLMEEKRIIFISTHIIDDKIEISFYDNAKGIPLDVIDNIFDNHFTTKQDRDGTGIGLYMSKIIIQKMNGTISANNEEFILNKNEYYGAKFTLSLPIN